MEDSLQDVIRISNEVGSDPKLVQGGGGNTSTKTDDGRMFVKASGTALKDMQEGQGYRCVEVEACLAILDDPEVAQMDSAAREQEVSRRLTEACVDDLEGRPSVESSLHAQLGRCVAHTHPAILNGVLCSQDGRQVVEDLFGDLDPPCLYLEYTNFGYPLARSMRESLQAYEEEHGRLPQVMFLENHGLFVSADTAEEAVSLTRKIVDEAERAWQDSMGPTQERHPFTPDRQQETEFVDDICAMMRRTYAEIVGAPVLVRFSLGTSTSRFFAYRNCESLAECGPLVPDQVVYCNGAPMWLGHPEENDLTERAENLIRENEAGPDTPACLLVDGVGMFTVALSPKLQESAVVTMEAVLDMLVVADCFGGPRPLTPESVQFIRDSESEAYRHRLVAGEEKQEDLAGQVAVVTGAGSGLGRGISIGLAKRGMHVVLADIDPEGARETRRRIEEEEETPGSGYPARVDVTSERAVDDLYEYVVRNLGGVDVLVNCAGIAPASPLVDFPVDAFRKALDINLTGYFLMARGAARLMKRQGTGGSIINLSSKSGLDASKNNSAYNATKAGEIHLARGWAQEVAEFGVRVNSVCPGNVFRESKIWNEEYIEVVAEKRGIEPDEVIPYYINLTALKEEIDWDDIADAVAFLSSPRASKITGQTLVVDAGQVFVR